VASGEKDERGAASFEHLKHVGLDNEALRKFNMTYDSLAAPEQPNRRNYYRQNRAALKQGKFSGFHSFTHEDAAVVLSAGAIKDRTRRCSRRPMPR
jgi:hypothetical protein